MFRRTVSAYHFIECWWPAGGTGIGKSMVVDALGLLFGGRASADMVRSDTDRARMAGIFEAPRTAGLRKLLEDAGVEGEYGGLNSEAIDFRAASEFFKPIRKTDAPRGAESQVNDTSQPRHRSSISGTGTDRALGQWYPTNDRLLP
jgi:hypothetical protein